jgi:hypothetical protein
MPHLHLPIDHTDADVVLAANLAEIVGSEDLYVAWSHEGGPGAIPEVEALVVEQRYLSPLGEVAAALAAGFAAFWRALTGRPEGHVVHEPAATDAPRAEAERPHADS